MTNDDITIFMEKCEKYLELGTLASPSRKTPKGQKVNLKSLNFSDAEYFDKEIEPVVGKWKLNKETHERFVTLYDYAVSQFKKTLRDEYFNIAQICYELSPKDKLEDRKPMTEVSLGCYS